MNVKAQPIALGTVICQRNFELYTPQGEPRPIVVRLGLPVATTTDGRLLGEGEESSGVFRCPVQITGLNIDERVDGIFGEDPFVALQYAIDFIGYRLDAGLKDLKLANKQPSPTNPDSRQDSWIWSYPRHRSL